VPPEQYVGKHRAAPAPTQPPALTGAPRHAGTRARVVSPPRAARGVLRNAVTFGGLAAAATGVAVAAGVLHSHGTPVNLADSLSPVSAAGGVRAGGSAGGGSASAGHADDLSQRTREVSRSADRSQTRDPAKQAALGLTSGPAVGGQEDLSSQDPQGIAEALLPSYGWSSSQMSCLVPLWMGESGWRVNAENASSGAYGIPQALPGSKMASAGADWQTNPATQITWGLGYIQERYGSPCGAWGFKQGHGWY
jgi:hypothetical protein